MRIEQAHTLDSDGGRAAPLSPSELADVLLSAALGPSTEVVRTRSDLQTWAIDLVEGGVARSLGRVPETLARVTFLRLALLSGIEVGAGERHGRVLLSLGEHENEVLVTLSGWPDQPEVEVRRLTGPTLGWLPSLVEPSVGDRYGSYVIEGIIGRGGHGTVYRARHETLGRSAAVKVLNASRARSSQSVMNFIAEARAAGRIDHPGIVDVLDFGKTPGGETYLVMELIEEPTLRDLSQAGSLTVEMTLRITANVCDALQQAHLRSVIHCDLKPDNIFVLPDAKVKLVDFGSARLLDLEHGKDQLLRLAGTPHYMAPEYLTDARPAPSVDIYAVGCLLYEALTGHMPFEADSFKALMEAHRDLDFPHLPNHPELDAIIQRATTKDPAQRYPTALALADALRSTWARLR